MEVFREFANYLTTTFSVSIADINIEETVKTIESEFYPEAMKIIQKDSSFFSEPRVLFGVNLSELYVVGNDEMWKNIQMCSVASFTHGDIQEKVGTLFNVVKSMWAGKDDAVSKILNDETSEGHFKEILEFVMESRLAKVFMKMAEELDISEFDLKFDNPQELIEMMKNPEHPMIKKITSKVTNLIKEKIRTGAISQEQIMQEVEAIKAKVISLFGNAFGDALGLQKGEIPAAVMMGNSPEARRQRILARLQKKLREKNSR